MMNKKDAEKIIKDLSEKPFVCSEHCIETESGYVIKTKEKRKYTRSKKPTNADRIRNMTDEELAKFMDSVICSATYGDGEDCTFPICASMCGKLCNGIKENTNKYYLEWLQAEVKEGE